MNITIKKIADLAKVSRGTVDRVLHDRPGVKPEVRQKVLNILKALDYKPNLAGKALVYVNRQTKFGVVVTPDYNPFVEKIKQGVVSQTEQISSFGVELDIEVIRTYNENEQLYILDQLQKQGVKALSIMPLDRPRIRKKINELVSQNIPVITCNSDIQGTERLCFVGQDNVKGGRTAGDLMKKLLPGKSNIAVITSTMELLCHQNRIAGFSQVIEESGLYTLSAIEENDDRDDTAFELAQKYIETIDNLAGIYISGGGIKGVGQALKIFGKEHDIALICHDLLDDSINLLKQGIVDFVIEQNPFQQGALPVQLLFNYLFLKEQPKKEIYYTDIRIYTAENM